MSERGSDARLARVLGSPGPELTCEECFEDLDRYVELERAGTSPDQQIPGMRAHLEGCPACAEDHEGLHALLDADGPPASDQRSDG